MMDGGIGECKWIHEWLYKQWVGRWVDKQIGRIFRRSEVSSEPVWNRGKRILEKNPEAQTS